MSGKPLALQIGEYVAQTSYAALPQEVTRHAKFLLLDSLGVAICGATTSAARAVHDVVKKLGGPGEATVWRHGDRVSGVGAAFANAMFAHALDYNDDNAGVQVGGVAGPVAISVAEAIGASGRDAILAAVIAHDMAARVAVAADPQGLYLAGVQPTALCGVFAGAAAAARLLGLSANAIANALGIAGSYAGGTIEFLSDGANTKPLHVAKSGHLGALAAHLAAAGMTGPKTIFEGQFGILRAFSKSPRPEKLIDGLGSRYDILQTSVKLYPCADGNAPPLQSALAIVRDHKLTLDQIASLHFRIKSFLVPFGMRFNGDSSRRYRPQNELDARMSLPYCVALGLIKDGRLEPDDFSPERFADPQVQSLSDRISAEGDPELDKIPLMPMSMPAIATLKTTDGRVFTKRVDHQIGDPRNPFTPQDFHDKFERCVRGVLSERRKNEVMDTVLKMDEVGDVREIAHLFVSDTDTR